MASHAASPNPPPAPWRSEFLDHLSAMPSPEFVLSTLHPVSNQAPNPAAPTSENVPVPYLPRARFCIHRGMWSTLPENKHNDAERNPHLFKSDCPTFTSDSRMQKVGELFATSSGKANEPAQTQGSGGGGPVEAVYWVKEKMVQWRIKGSAWIVAPDIESSGSSGVRSVKSEVGKRMRLSDRTPQEDKGRENEWSWARELRGHFGNVSPAMRGSFKQPPPGQPVDQPYDKNEKMGEKITDLDEEVSRRHFRVVVIVPDEVERTELTEPDKARRLVWRFEGDKVAWSEPVETWP
ncbi:MAG: hypothetical protein Q9159_001571 [Coniocarpon cinnabarinum]